MFTTVAADSASDNVSVDEHRHHQRLKGGAQQFQQYFQAMLTLIVMRACEGCRRRKIQCDATTTNEWPCSVCVRLKLHCVPPASKELEKHAQKLEQRKRETFVENEKPRTHHQRVGNGLKEHREFASATLTPVTLQEPIKPLSRKKGYLDAHARTYDETLGLIHHRSSDIKIEDLHNTKTGILDFQKARKKQAMINTLTNTVLILNVLAVAVILRILEAIPWADLAFISWLYMVMEAAILCESFIRRKYIRWYTHQRSIGSDYNVSTGALQLHSSSWSARYVHTLWLLLLPTLTKGLGKCFSLDFQHQNAITLDIWDALWCVLGMYLKISFKSIKRALRRLGFSVEDIQWFGLVPMLLNIWTSYLLILQTGNVTITGLTPIAFNSIRSILKQLGSHVDDLQWSFSDLMSAGRSLKMRYPYFLPPRNWQLRSSGKRCVHGQCRCGHRFVDEFTEVQPAAAANYENLLQERSSHPKNYPIPANRDQGTMDATNVVDTNTQTKGSTPMSSIAGGLATLMTLAFSLLGKRKSVPTLPQYQLETGGNQPQKSSTCDNELLYLLLCIPQHQFATRLLQPQISDITSDQSFFLLLRENHQQMKGRMRRLFSMKTLRSIKFVQLEMYKSELVDIRKLDDLPPEDKKDEYRYNPVPADIIPPVGENHMLHLISHPTHAEEDGFVLDRIPKKLKERLLVPPSRGTGLGWGIYFIEGWHFGVITLVAFAVLLAGSLAFLICWSVLEHDLQGASGVAAYMVAFLGLAIGSTQAMFELA